MLPELCFYKFFMKSGWNLNGVISEQQEKVEDQDSTIITITKFK